MYNRKDEYLQLTMFIIVIAPKIK